MGVGRGDSITTIPDRPDQQRAALLALLRQEPRGAAQRNDAAVVALITALERIQSVDLGDPATLQRLEGVWELRWSSSRQTSLRAAPWWENLQVLQPSAGRALNLLRPSGPLAALGGLAVEATIRLDQVPQRVAVRFRRGGWLGPPLPVGRVQWLPAVQQAFPAWLDITVLDDALRLCRGNAGTCFALLRRPDLELDELLPSGAAPSAD